MVEWTYSHVATAVDGLGTMILESATRYSPTALASLRMDVSRLKDRGLARMKRVLKQSNLEQLFVECEAFDLSRSSLVGQVLGAVRWSNIVSLEISGSCINDFLQVWMLYGNPFEPFDPSSVESAFSGNELELDNQDWDLVIDAIDFSELTVLGMFKSNFQDVQMLLEKLGEQRTPLEKLDLRYTPADEELRKKFRYN
ncbi:hypothetical protein CPC16_011855 [Podila verticillata]|nr:hypothetical protein CPC16_011855 [Podila verticillata]